MASTRRRVGQRVQPWLCNGHTQEQAAAQALFVSGFTDLDTGVVRLNRDRGDPGTLAQQALHLRSSRTFVESVHRKVNEGITEFFTRRVCAAAQVARGTDSYPQEHAAVEAALEARRPGLWLDWRIAMTRRISDAIALLDGVSSSAAGSPGADGAGDTTATAEVPGARPPDRLRSPAAPAR